MLHYIRYKCKNCGLEKKVLEQWGDLRPKICTGKKCKTRFEAQPDKLEIILPKQPEQSKETKKTTSKRKKKEEDELPLQEHQVHDN